jgi:DNA-binding transcriptional LysR family regulator
MEINLKLMSTFVLVADCGSLTAAAARCFRSVSAVSMQISELESQIGVRLFERTTRHLELTFHGQLLYTSASRAIADLGQVTEALQGDQAFNGGRLSLACIPSFAENRLPKLLSAYRSNYPDVKVEVYEASSPNVFEMVRDKKVQLGIGVRTSTEDPILISNRIFKESIVALVPKSFNISAEGPIELKEIFEHPVIMFSSGSSLYEQARTLVKQRKISINSTCEVMHIHTAIAMVEHGIGIALIPRFALPTLTNSVALSLTNPVLEREVCIISNKELSVGTPTSTFANYITKSTAEMS